jgi:hypothetical protein
MKKFYSFDDSKLSNPYEGEFRNHHLVEGEISGIQTAINMLEEKITLLHLEYEAGIAAANDMTVSEYREASREASER